MRIVHGFGCYGPMDDGIPKQTPYFAPLRIGAVVHDFGHLDPLRFQIVSEKLGRAVTVRCRFSSHVFSLTFDPNSDPADAPRIMDGVRRRIFCPDRYRLSLRLPTAILTLRSPRIYVRETRSRRNWLYVATVEPTEAAAGEVEGPTSGSVRYQIFFTLRKAARGGATREDVEMVVESAYAEDVARSPNLLGRALFVGLATAIAEGRQVHTGIDRKR